MSSPAIDRINRLTEMVLKGIDPSPEDMKSALVQLREERQGAAERSTASRKAREPAEPIDIAALFKPKPDEGASK